MSPNWTQYSRWGLTKAQERGRTTSLDLLAMLFLMHPGTPFVFLATKAHCCWLMDNLSIRIPRSLSSELLSSRSVPSQYWFLGLFLPMCRALHLLLLNFKSFLFSTSPAWLDPSEGQHSAQGYQPLLPMAGALSLHPSQWWASWTILGSVLTLGGYS